MEWNKEVVFVNEFSVKDQSVSQISVDPPRLQVLGVSKSYPGVKALQNVSLSVAVGEVHALVGENGAGKSTLMRLIAGVESLEQGDITLDGKSIKGIDEHRAGVLGIGMVHQERSLISGLSVAENVYAGRQPVNRIGAIDKRQMNDKTAFILDELRVNISTNRLVSDLSPAQAQMVEIAKALSYELKVLILDEPTATLTITETEHLFEVIRHLSARGVSVLYISHRLGEVFEVCNRVTVLRDGQITGQHGISEVSEHDLIKLMVGREITLFDDQERSGEGTVILEVQSLRSEQVVRDASLTIRTGEIVCLAGLIGSGRTEFCETLFGVRQRTGGHVFMNGRELDIKHPLDAMRLGIGMVPEDRKEAGLFLEMSITMNFVSGNLNFVSKLGILSRTRMKSLAQSYVNQLRVVTPGLDQKVVNLSGGNQQKVLLGKWLARKPTLLIVDEPTRGVDVGARAEIYQVLRSLAKEGLGVLVVSSDLPEVLNLAHRIVVMAEGRTVGELRPHEADEVAILKLATLENARVEVR